MKKTMLTLIALLVMAVQFAGAQNYEVEYEVKFNSSDMEKMITGGQQLPPEIMASLRQDIQNAQIFVKVNMSKDKEDVQLLSDKCYFTINLMGNITDMKPMIEMMGLSTYTDYAKQESYTKLNIQGTKYLVKSEMEPQGEFEVTKKTKKILGHECVRMKTKSGKIWYATDMPFETMAYKGVPGVILAMEINGTYMTAVSVTPNDKEISLPTDAKIVTREEMEKIMMQMQ